MMNRGRGAGSAPRHSLTILVLWLVCTSLLGGCASMGMAPSVKDGDIAVVDYTCRLKSGEVVVTTRQEVADDLATRAQCFLPFKEYGPVDLVAGRTDKYPTYGRLKIFELEVNAQIARVLPGMRVGRTSTILIKADTPPDLTDHDRYITLSRIQREEKDQPASLEEVKKMLGHDPTPRDRVFSYKGITGTVKSVKEKEVILHLDVKDGAIVDQPFGNGIIKDYPDHYDIITDAKVGHVVRSMSQMGRIVSVDEKTFTLDYGNPFGGEELLCDVLVNSILPGPRAVKQNEAGGGQQ